ncbi:hypothetical protein [Brachyspira murdochii]|uniref:hypothetical protein n=1 Tax=Brachyspira murdochii TaxID=84378 RepID=UPI0012F4E93E|nr:hypothetical protein [Brachyspira murdochii]
MIQNLWNNEVEITFFKKSLENFLPIEKLFYKIDDKYYAYIPKNIKNMYSTLQSRNSLIGKFTEKWVRDLISPIVEKYNLFAVNGAICEEIGLSKKSSADLALCTNNEIYQTPKTIKAIFEIKMSIVSNYIINKNCNIEYLGDYKTHKGNPSLLRSDSMLKAIGKAINIRVSSNQANNIPIIVIGNSPITNEYTKKVDSLKQSGIIQYFISLNPSPTKSNFITNSDNRAFITINNIFELDEILKSVIKSDLNYFSSMITKDRLGNIITISNMEKNEILKAEKFLKLLNEV